MLPRSNYLQCQSEGHFLKMMAMTYGTVLILYSSLLKF